MYIISIATRQHLYQLTAIDQWINRWMNDGIINLIELYDYTHFPCSTKCLVIIHVVYDILYSLATT